MRRSEQYYRRLLKMKFNTEFRLKHLWPSTLAFFSGVNFTLAEPVNLVVGLLTFVSCVFIIYENVMEEKVNERHS